MSDTVVQEPLRDLIGRVLYEEPGRNYDWYAISEERREPWRQDADRVITLLTKTCTARMEQAAYEMGAVDWLAASPAEVLAEMMGAESGCRFPVCPASEMGGCLTCPVAA